MSDDLDDFLRQAAERRAKRQEQKSGRPAPTSPSQPKPAATSKQPPNEKRRPAVAEVVTERPNVGRLQPGLSDRHVESNLEQSDERMEARLKQVFRSDLDSRRASTGGADVKQLTKEDISSDAPMATEQIRASVSSRDLKQQLREPQTLRLAIIAHEILRRPYE
jgi:hypothetical protein